MTTNNRGRPKTQTPGSGGANGNDDGTPPLGVPDFETGRDHERLLPAARGLQPIPLGKQPPPGLLRGAHPKPWTPTLQSPPPRRSTSLPPPETSPQPHPQPATTPKPKGVKIDPAAAATPPATINPRPIFAASGSQSSEDFARQVGWTALVESVTQAAQAMYPDDARSVALTVANTLQPYMMSFLPQNQRSIFDTAAMPGANTQGNTPGTQLSKNTENIILNAMTGKKSA